MDALLLVIALVCFIIAALKVIPVIDWIAVGLAFFVAGHIWTHLTIR